MKDLYSDIGVVAAVVPATLTATNTSAAIDLQGFDSATVIIQTGAIGGSGNFTPSLVECATSGGSYTAVATTDLIGSFTDPLAASSVYKIGYRGNKRYIKTVLTLNSGTNIVAGVVVVKSHAANAPVA